MRNDSKRRIRRNNSKSRENYKGRKEDRKIAIRKVKMRTILTVMAVSAGVTAGGMKLIEKIQQEANQSQTTKQAILVAENSAEYENQIKDINVQKDMNQFLDLIEKYEMLNEKDDKTAVEKIEYIQTAKDICEMYPEVIEYRTAVLKTEIANAVGIVSPEEIADIDVTCMWHGDSGAGEMSYAKIEMPSGEIYDNANIDGKLKNEIKSVKTPLKEKNKKKSVEELSEKELYARANEVMKYYNDIDYEQKYNIEVKENKKGQELKTVRDEQKDEREN